MYIKGIKKGEEYSTLKRTIVILIADFEVKSIKELEYHTKWKLIEEKERKVILTDKLEIHIIELPKLKGREEGEEKNKKDIAKEMLKNNIDIEIIVKITKLSEEEIQKLKE